MYMAYGKIIAKRAMLSVRYKTYIVVDKIVHQSTAYHCFLPEIVIYTKIEYFCE